MLPKGQGVSARVGKTQLRFSRVKRLASSSRRARILFSMRVFPVSFYGHVAHPPTSSQLKLFDNMAVACTGIKQASRCKTSALIVAYGQNTHPAARIVTDLFKSWLRLLNGFETKFGSLALIKQAWRVMFAAYTQEGSRKVLVKLGSKKSRSKMARLLATRKTSGTASNIFFTSLSLDWEPLAFDVWMSPDSHVRA